MFHSSSAFPEMTATGNAASFHQSTTVSPSTPVYVPSSRPITHSPYGHTTNFPGSIAQNGWPTDSFSSTHSQLSHQFYTQNVMMGSWRAYDPTGLQRTSPYGKLYK